MLKSLKVGSCSLLFLMSACGVEDAGEGDVAVTTAALEAGRNPHGIGESFHTTGAIDRTNPFFQVLGPNPRTCETCHASDQDWALSAQGIRKLFRETDGLAPLFMLHDAGSRPDADISTLEARKVTFETLTSRGLIRFGRTIPATAEFIATEVVDPAGFATVTQMVSFRRPTPTVNEAKVPNTNWNGGPHPDMALQLANTLGGAARFHGQRPDAVPPELGPQAAQFQLGLFFAQIIDEEAGRLDAAGAKGGPENLAAQPFHVGVNDIQGLDPENPGQPFNRKVFNIFDAWAVYDRHHGHGHDHDRDCRHRKGHNDSAHRNGVAAARASIYRGQEIFNNKKFDITGVNGLNDLLGQTTVRGTCSTCHNNPNVGSHSVFRQFDVGTADEPNCWEKLPLVTLQNKADPTLTRKVCEIGRGATAPGIWNMVGAFRAPPLRGLAARSPYFHDGQARTIADVIKYFDRRFDIGLSHREKRDLENFLGAL
jgi:cytochrome c peroxidase